VVAPAAQIALSWQDNATNETGFKIERAADGVSFVQVAMVGANVASFNDAAVAPATTYSFRVRAYNASGDSAYSNVAVVTTPPATPANTAPTISNVADRSISEDGTTGAIAFTVSDVETAASSLVVSASSSNAALLPVSGLVLGGSGSARTLTATPVANQNGTATITLTVGDGALTATDTFVLTVNAANDAPTISNLTDRTINAGSSTGAIAFSVGDVETAASSLAVTAASSNTTLVAASGIALGGSGSSRTINLTPVPGQSGSTTITVTVNDGAASVSDTFVLTVNPMANTAPTISDLANRTINEDGSTGLLPFTVSDAETAAGSLMVTAISSNTTLVPTSGLVLGGSGSSRTLAVTPASNRSGSATITVTVNDGALTTTDSFVLTVTAVNDVPVISAIANRTIERGTTTGAISFTVSDGETPAASLTLSATSSNLTLVPATSIILGGSGAARTVTITPEMTQSGTATITIIVNDGALSASSAFTLTVAAAPEALTASDIGATRLAGSTTLSNGVFTIRASGTGIGGTRDSFHFARQQIQGDAELIVHVASLVRTNGWAKAGVMFRSTLAANASWVGAFATPDYGIVLQVRATNGAASTQVYALPGKVPEWLRLIRDANSFLAFRSENGIDWEFIESVDCVMPATIYGGLAVTSRNKRQRTTATFDFVAID
jgi:hypothetical protein